MPHCMRNGWKGFSPSGKEEAAATPFWQNPFSMSCCIFISQMHSVPAKEAVMQRKFCRRSRLWISVTMRIYRFRNLHRCVPSVKRISAGCSLQSPEPRPQTTVPGSGFFVQRICWHPGFIPSARPPVKPDFPTPVISAAYSVPIPVFPPVNSDAGCNYVYSDTTSGGIV